MGLLKTMLTFTDGTTMSISDIEGVFIETATEDGIYNVINEISDDDNGTPGNIKVSPDFREDMFQFFAFRGAGGHSHDIDVAGLGAPLAADSVNTQQINRNESTIIYTGQLDTILNKGTLTGLSTAPTVISGHTVHWVSAALDLYTDGDWVSPNIRLFAGGQWPVVVATPIKSAASRINVFVNWVTAPNTFAIELISDVALVDLTVNWIAMGIAA